MEELISTSGRYLAMLAKGGEFAAAERDLSLQEEDRRLKAIIRRRRPGGGRVMAEAEILTTEVALEEAQRRENRALSTRRK